MFFILNRVFERVLRLRGKRRVQRLLIFFALAATAAAIGGCTGGSTQTPPPKRPSGLSNRAFITVDGVSFGSPNGITAIVDANTDTASSASIGSGQTPDRIVLTPDKTKALVIDTRGHQTLTLDTNTESVLATSPTGDVATSAVIMSDNKTSYVAVRNFGQVMIFDITTGNRSSTINNLPEVRTLILGHNSKKILAFSDDSDVVNVIDTTANTSTPVADPSSVYSRPVFGIFSSDDSKAYIVSCGPECGGAGGPNVSVLDMTTLTPGTPTAVAGASIALLDSSNLYVAGTPTGSATGTLQVLNATTLVAGGAKTISGGFHDRMALGGSLLFIGAHTGRDDNTACSNGAQGCLSMFNTGSQAVTIETAKGGVTGIEAFKGRNAVYVIEGGELVIYDPTTAKPQAKQLDIIGTAADVKAVDQ